MLLSCCRRCRGLRPAAARLRLSRQNRVHLVAFHPRHRLGNRYVGELLHEALENSAPDFRMGHLPPPEKDGGLHLVTVFEEALDVLLLELVVVLVHLRPELDLLDLDDLLVPPRLARASAPVIGTCRNP